MSLNRRSFIGLSSLVACGTALEPTSLFAAAPRALRGGLPLRTGDEAVLAFVHTYSANVRVVGASVLARIRTSGLRALHVLAEVPDLAALEAALLSVPFPFVYSQGNILTFTVGDVDATVENLTPAVFAARMAAMLKRGGNAFAHDALAYDPATNLLADPFAARSGALKIVNKTFGGDAALDVALRGTFEAGQLGLPADADFAAWKGRVLRQIARAADAPKLSKKFLTQLVALADKLPPAAFQSLLRSRLISTALQQVFGIDTAAVIAKFQELRPTVEASISDAALWLSLLIAPEIESNSADGAALNWLSEGAHFPSFGSRAALGQAEKIIKDYSSNSF